MKTTGRCGNNTIYIEGNLTHHRGNKKPHFSITGEIPLYIFGCCHDEILRARPDLKGFVDLHLSDIDGIPLHAIENGYYWLTAVQGINHWEESTDKNYLDIFARYMRISLNDARDLSERIHDKGEFTNWIESQKPRYKQEADNLIKKYGLTVIISG